MLADEMHQSNMRAQWKTQDACNATFPVHAAEANQQLMQAHLGQSWTVGIAAGLPNARFSMVWSIRAVFTMLRSEVDVQMALEIEGLPVFYKQVSHGDQDSGSPACMPEASGNAVGLLCSVEDDAGSEGCNDLSRRI